jgi:1-phosphofructokinase family hexose kinase
MSGGVDGPRARLLFVAANPSIDRLYELDRLAVGEIQRPVAVVAVPGGKGLNAARAAAALGGTVCAVGIVAGRAGEWIAEQLINYGIDRRLARAGGETRTCVSILDRSSGALTEIYERGAEIEPADWAALEAIVEGELDQSDVAAIALSGSLPPGAPPDGYARIARIAAARPVPVAVLADTYGPALRSVLAEGPELVKLNADEAGEMRGILVADPAAALDAARVIRAAGARTVVVTLGTAGAVIASADGEARLVPPDLRGPYSVGSGDAVLGGLAVGWQRGRPFVDAARLGLAAGIANAQVPGAGRLDRATADGLVERIEVVEV